MQSLCSKILGAKLFRSWKTLVISLLVLAVALAAIAGSRLDSQARASLAGAVCGVAAAVPTSIVIASVRRRRAIAANERAARCHTLAQQARRRAARFERLALWSPHGHQFAALAWIEHQVAAALDAGDPGSAVELTRSAPALPDVQPEAPTSGYPPLILDIPGEFWGHD